MNNGSQGNQDRLINQFFSRYLPFQPYAQRVFARENIKFEDIKTAEDLKKVPFCSKTDLLPTPDNPTSARDFILQPNEELIKKYWKGTKLLGLIAQKALGRNVKAHLEYEFKPTHIHFTTGRSSAPIPFFYSSLDMETFAKSSRRLFEIVGATKDDIVVNAFPFAPHLAFWLGAIACQTNRLLSLQSGGGKILGTQKILDAIEKMRATLLMVIPGYGYHLFREAIEQKRDFSSLRLVIFGGEAVTEGFRSKCRELLEDLKAKNVKLLATYAFTEGKTAWAQCGEESDYHLFPDLEYVELINKEGSRVGENERGEVVYTSLGWRASVVARYKTGDWCDGLSFQSCPKCGRSLPLLKRRIERASDNLELNLTKIKGELVNLGVLKQVISEVGDIDEWQIEIRKKNNDPYELDELVLHASLKQGVSEAQAKRTLERTLRNQSALTAQIEFHSRSQLVDMLSLERELKEKRIVDRRKVGI